MKNLIIILIMSLSFNAISQVSLWDSWTIKYAGQKEFFPEYGKLQKSVEELKADEKFIETFTMLGYTTKEASIELASKAWADLRQAHYEDAMRRFNQAWLLEANNANALWGFGALLAALENTEGSIKYLELAYQNNSSATNLLIDISTAYLLQYNNDKDTSDLEKGLAALLKYLKSDAKNEEALYKTAIYYYHLQDYSTSWNYVDKCKKQGGSVIQPGFIDALSKKMKNPKS